MKKSILLLTVLNIFLLGQSQPTPSWNLTGNSGTNPGFNFLGTTDNNPLKFRVANVYAGEIDSVTGKTFFGYAAGKSTFGLFNVGVGFKALYSNTTGAHNTANGYTALYSNVQGSANTAYGSQALYFNTTAAHNTAIGYTAMYYNTTGAGNTAVGSRALIRNSTANDNTAIGNVALSTNTTGSNNTATGSSALGNNTTGAQNTATGSGVMLFNTTGWYNTAMGVNALYSNNTGSDNTAVGWSALNRNTTGTENIAIGAGSMYYSTTAHANVAIGNSALSNNGSGGYNVAIGRSAMLNNTTGNSNAAVGSTALSGNTTGFYNTAMGSSSLGNNASGSYNTACGSGALNYTYYAYYNTAVGYNAGRNYNMGWNNTIIGALSDVNASDRYNCVALGQGVICTANSQARIGNSSTSSIGGYANWTNFSDGRYKKDINQNVKGLDFIMKLQPITYHLDISGLTKKLHDGKNIETDEFTQKAIAEKEKILFSGFVAQDVEKAAQETGYDFSGVDKPKNEKDFYGLRYAEFVVPLVKAMQEQQQMINELIKQNSNLQKRVDDLEKNPGTGYTPSGSTKEILSAWPNPSNDIVFIQIASEIESPAVVKVFDNRGGLVKEHRTSVIPGRNQVSIDMKGLASGTYHFSAEWHNSKMKRTVQVIKQ